MKPFDSLNDFEAVRALALADLNAAASQLALQTHVSSNTLVRIYYGPPGTGKTLLAVQQAIKIADPGFAEQDDFSACFRRMNELREQVAFMTFHPSLQYEDVVEAIRPRLVQDDANTDGAEEPDAGDETERVAGAEGKLGYDHYQGPLIRLAGAASRDASREFVVIVDEINRGDASRILGPLMSALEPDKRAGSEYPIGFERQYPSSPEEETRSFLPSNLHILGTMNSADRNIALVDYALRRRFEFIQCPPRPALLSSTRDVEPLDLESLLSALNERIAHLLDDDHRIGHGYLLRAETNEEVVRAFATRILPLLFEYFYGDEGMIALVLGDRVGGNRNVLRIQPPNQDFRTLFGLPLEAASAFGLRTTREHPTVEVDTRFWNAEGVPPGPEDLGYAVSALRKIYEAEADEAIGPEDARDSADGPDSVAEGGDRAPE